MGVVLPVGFELWADMRGADYATLLAAVDAVRADGLTLLADQFDGLPSDNPMGWVSPGDIPQAQQWAGVFTQATSQIGSAGLTVTGAPLGTLSPSGVASGQNGFWQRRTAMVTAFRQELVSVSGLIAQYGSSPVVDIPSYLAAQGVQASATFASLFWWIYSLQLAPANVFAPTGVDIGSVAITGSDACTLTAGHFVTANGYTSPAPTTDAYSNNVYLGGCPMAQGFAPVATIRARVTSAINGTCALTVHAPNQSGASGEWLGTLDGLAIGATVNLTVVTGGDLCNGAVTAASVAGTATSGAFVVETVALR